ncbi:MAG: lectin [Mizugakiibacter sp.]|uniref:lectin n=1 Tax=Mizugakiibacter sp. TaxID=1972610 RepID=UPI0031C5A213|nr:lectin [Xanthomonadaceae bacterium]
MRGAALAATFAAALLAGCAAASPSAAAPPATAPRAVEQPPMPARAVDDAQPDFNGIGPLHWNMDAASMRRAWGRPLYPEAAPADARACYYLSPRQGRHDLLLMVEGDRFVRVDVRRADKVAPGGGRVGMRVEDIRRLYAGRIEARPHRYVEGGQTLVVASPYGGAARLVFEIGADGAVSAWRIGLPPQVDYVEGCS